ncbi:uncharacterized protein [Chelonus insularis]|uniref:uncharacterized protein n=1 Tax=Chelonus insularis TaxID=460826 RepID=UPI00158855C2|nr:uncharacterized protein LOC118074845 [Chelonus insularis]
MCSSNHVKISLLFMTILIIIQSASSHNIPTAKFGWTQLLEFENRVCQHYCENINHWNNRSSKTILFCMLNCPFAFTSTPKNFITSTTTAIPITSTSLGTLSTASTAPTTTPTLVTQKTK